MMGCEGLKAIRVTRSSNKNVEEEEEEEEPLSPLARLLHGPDMNTFIIMVLAFKTPINLLVFKQHMSRLLFHPRFSSLLVKDGTSGKLKWVRTVVDINNHIVVPTLDLTAVTSPEKLVGDYISDLTKTVLDMSKPLWEFHVLNVKTSEAESTAVFRLHHSIGDGASLLSLLNSLATDPISSTPAIKPRRRRSTSSSCSDYIMNGLMRIWFKSTVVANTVYDSGLLMTTACFQDTKTCLRSSYGVGWHPRKFVRKTISLDDVKIIKNAMGGATINDVMLGVIQAGLSRYLNRNYGKSVQDPSTNYLPKNIHLRAMVVFNLRPCSGIPDLAEMLKPKSKVRWGNKAGTAILSLNIMLKHDLLDYIRESKIIMDRKKASHGHKFAYFTIKTILKPFPALARLSSRGTTLIFSNVRGFEKEITVFGHQVANHYASIYGTQAMALVIHTTSYANKMNVVLSIDERVISDSEELSDDFMESFELMKRAVMDPEMN